MKFDFNALNFEILDANTNAYPDIFINQNGVTFTKKVLDDPVSYTHLDVYKRQLSARISWQKWASHLRKFRAMLADCKGAVSYTHLDVYKRQVFCRLLGGQCHFQMDRNGADAILHVKAPFLGLSAEQTRDVYKRQEFPPLSAGSPSASSVCAPAFPSAVRPFLR